jgi:hypothetical protein
VIGGFAGSRTPISRCCQQHSVRTVIENEKGEPKVIALAVADEAAVSIATQDKVVSLIGAELAGLQVIRLADKKPLLSLAAGNAGKGLLLGSLDEKYTVHMTRESDGARLALSTLGTGVVQFSAQKSGGFGMITNMDFNARLLGLMPEGARSMTRAEAENSVQRQRAK